MAQINKSSDYFNTKLYTGDGSNPRTLTGVGFQPDWVWLKNRTDANGHTLADAVRGANKTLSSDGTGAEVTDKSDGHLDAFTSDGFTVGAGTDDARVNNSGSNYVAWNWLGANGTSSNTDGSITSNVSANTTSGFSIVSYDGEGSAGDTVGHGLGVVPKVMILKRLESADSWSVYHSSVGATKRLRLNTTDATQTSSSFFNDTEPTSSFFTLGANSEVNGSAEGYIAYCFAEKKGFSKFGKFISNGSDDGTFTYCGFKPAWVMMKANVTDGWSHWFIFDNKRDTYNLADLPQYANLAIQDGYYGGTPATNYSQIDMLSNGFKMRRDGNWGLGGSGTEVIYMAFAESPLVGTNDIPATAR